TGRCQCRADSSRGQVPGLRQKLSRRVSDDLALAARERDAVESELPEPLPAAAARRRGDPDRLEVARAAAAGDGLRDRRLLRADAERIRGVLDVDALEHPPVSRENRRADEIVR